MSQPGSAETAEMTTGRLLLPARSAALRLLLSLRLTTTRLLHRRVARVASHGSVRNSKIPISSFTELRCICELHSRGPGLTAPSWLDLAHVAVVAGARPRPLTTAAPVPLGCKRRFYAAIPTLWRELCII